MIVLGHGGYAAGVRSNLEMLAGESTNIHFLDLTSDEGITPFEANVRELLSQIEGPVLFGCDIFGASPFKLAARLCVERQDGSHVVAGLNAITFVELRMKMNRGTNSASEDVAALAAFAIETTRASVAKFPQ